MRSMVAKIPMSQITRVALYVNVGRKTMAQVKAELGCQYLINAGLFDLNTFRPMNLLIKDGKKLAGAGGKFGYSMQESSIAFSYDNNVMFSDHVSGYPCLVRNGAIERCADPAGLSGYRARSAIGLTSDSLLLRAVGGGFTLSMLAADMKARGCKNAVNLDGGGSTQCSFGGESLVSSRIVHNYIAVWVKPQKLRVLLIAGHGGIDPGAIAFGRREADLAREFTPRLKSAMAPFADVTIADPSFSMYDYLFRRKGSYNFKPYDYVLEVHFNAYAKDLGDGKRKGSEVYVTTSEKIVTAEAAMLKNLASLGFPNRGVKKKNYSVIREAKRQGASSALLEVCFLDDMDDMTQYLARRDAVAAAIAAGLREGYRL